MADFGQTDFGQFQSFWSFGEILCCCVVVLFVVLLLYCCFVVLLYCCVVLCCCVVVLLFCVVVVLSLKTLNLAWESGRRPTCSGFGVVVVVVVVVVAGLDFPGPPSAGPPSTGPPSAGPPKISLFLFPFPPPFRCFCVSLGVFSLNFGGVLKRRGLEMCTFGLSGCRVKPRWPHQTGPPGLAHDSPRTPNAHIQGTALQTPPTGLPLPGRSPPAGLVGGLPQALGTCVPFSCALLPEPLHRRQLQVFSQFHRPGVHSPVLCPLQVGPLQTGEGHPPQPQSVFRQGLADAPNRDHGP